MAGYFGITAFLKSKIVDLKLFLLSTQNMKRKMFQGSYEKIAISCPIAILEVQQIYGGSI